MSQEQRTHYQVLQVPRDAPSRVVVASYRRLMSRLRPYPDLPENREIAVRIEEAYAVLSEPTRRSAYDSRRSPAARESKQQVSLGELCPFCGVGVPSVIGATTRCNACQAPLAPVIATGPLAMPYSGRAHARLPQADFVQLRLQQTGPTYKAKLRDVSAGGLSLYCGRPPDDGRPLRVIAPKIDTVARVIKVRAHGPVSIVHAQMLTACYLNRAGVFVSAVF